jgi:SAM-dependent methyltransferase
MTKDENATVAAIHAAVARQYETYPYPDYGLFLPIRWQEAYASTALFAGQLTREHGFRPAIDHAGPQQVLIAGCGDILPAVLARWEPRSHRLFGLDLSRRSLLRARFRTWLGGRDLAILQADLADSSQTSATPYAHIDAYGVLHHMANPQEALHLLSQQLAPGGTLRLMVYNAEARTWIRHIQRAFALLDLSPYIASDLKQGRQLLELLRRQSPAYQERLGHMGSTMLNSTPRFVDTFFHAREAHIELSAWLNGIKACGLEAMGLFDRYAELDDLPNPLYRMPSEEELEERACDGRYENNLEVYCRRPGPRLQAQSPSLSRPLFSWRWSPPSSWRSYEDTSQLSRLTLWRLWMAFRQPLYRESIPSIDSALQGLPARSVQRLARLGAIWPSAIRDASRLQLFHEVLESQIERPERYPPLLITELPDCVRLIESILRRKARSPRYLPLVLKRLSRAGSS